MWTRWEHTGRRTGCTYQDSMEKKLSRRQVCNRANGWKKRKYRETTYPDFMDVLDRWWKGTFKWQQCTGGRLCLGGW
jgi:hypothetical protein